MINYGTASMEKFLRFKKSKSSVSIETTVISMICKGFFLEFRSYLYTFYYHVFFLDVRTAFTLLQT